jgi:hypothetical protein
MKNKIYTVRYAEKTVGGGSRTIVIFATYDEHLAKRYVRKFNRILSEAKEHWKSYKIERFYQRFSDHKQYETINKVFDTYDAYYLETEIR